MPDTKIHFGITYNKLVYHGETVAVLPEWHVDSLRDAILGKLGPPWNGSTDAKATLWLLNPPRDYYYRGELQDDDRELVVEKELLDDVFSKNLRNVMPVAIELPRESTHHAQSADSHIS